MDLALPGTTVETYRTHRLADGERDLMHT